MLSVFFLGQKLTTSFYGKKYGAAMDASTDKHLLDAKALPKTVRGRSPGLSPRGRNLLRGNLPNGFFPPVSSVFTVARQLTICT